MQHFKYEPMKISYKKKIELDDLTHYSNGNIFRDLLLVSFVGLPVVVFIIYIILYLSELNGF